MHKLISRTTLALALALALAFTLSACSGSSGGGPAAAAGEATLKSFTGEWVVTAHIVAPWFTGPDFAPDPDPEILAKTLTITETATKGAATLTCDAARFEVKPLPGEGLFEGNAPDPYIAKAALGIEQDQTPTLLESCTTGAGDMELSYHLIGTDKLLLGLDNIVYQFGRPSAEAVAPEAPPAAR